MDTVMAGIAVAIIVNPATGNNGNLSVLSNFKSVVNPIVEAGIGKYYRNMNGLPFGSGFYLNY